MIHVYPLGDTIDHDTDTPLCPCGPDLEHQEGGGTVVIHQALDGRVDPPR